MSGRNEFTDAEIEGIRSELRERRRTDPHRQEIIQGRLRRVGFYITDYSHDANGLTVSDFDEMIHRGTIRQRS